MQDTLILLLININDAWSLGVLFHATPHWCYFQDYVQGDFGYVYLGDDKACKVVRKRKVVLKLQNGNQWMLNHVRHVPNLKRNMISS